MILDTLQEPTSPTSPNSPLSLGIRRDLVEFTGTLTSSVARFGNLLVGEYMPGASNGSSHTTSGYSTPNETPEKVEGEETQTDHEDCKESEKEAVEEGEEQADREACDNHRKPTGGKLSEVLMSARHDVLDFQQQLAGELSRFATTILGLGTEHDAEMPAIPGITEEVLEYASQIAMHPQTWRGFPSKVPKTEVEYPLSEMQQLHCDALLALVPQMDELFDELCPNEMSEGFFWMTYYLLVHAKLDPADAELLSVGMVTAMRKSMPNQFSSEVCTIEPPLRDCDPNHADGPEPLAELEENLASSDKYPESTECEPTLAVQETLAATQKPNFTTSVEPRNPHDHGATSQSEGLLFASKAPTTVTQELKEAPPLDIDAASEDLSCCGEVVVPLTTKEDESPDSLGTAPDAAPVVAKPLEEEELSKSKIGFQKAEPTSQSSINSSMRDEEVSSSVGYAGKLASSCDLKKERLAEAPTVSSEIAPSLQSSFEVDKRTEELANSVHGESQLSESEVSAWVEDIIERPAQIKAYGSLEQLVISEDEANDFVEVLSPSKRPMPREASSSALADTSDGGWLVVDNDDDF